jgi:PAS domain S-box-containing protein
MKNGYGSQEQKAWEATSVDLRRLTLCDAARCGSALRDLARGKTCLEDLAQATTEYFYRTFKDQKTGNPDLSLVRFFKTHPYGDLPPDLQKIAAAGAQPERISEDDRCLVLLGSCGVEPEWNSRHESVAHQALPILDSESLAQMPMVESLFSGLGWDMSQGAKEKVNRTCEVFLIEEALGSPSIPSQKHFVEPYGIRSVVGFGGVAGDQELFCVLLFTKVHVGRRASRIFRSLGLCAQVGVASINTVFREQSTEIPSSKMGLTGEQLCDLLDIYEQNIIVQSELELTLQRALLLMPDSFLRLKSDGTILDYRGQWAFGQTARPEAFLGKNVQELLPAEAHSSFLLNIRSALETEGLLSCEYQLEVNGPRVFEARFAGIPSKNQVIVVIRDVTASRHDSYRLQLQSRVNQAVAELRKLPARAESESTLMQRCLWWLEELTESVESSCHPVLNGEIGHLSPDSSQYHIWLTAKETGQALVRNQLRKAEQFGRSITLPILELGEVVALLQVSGKATDYGEADLETVKRLSYELWQLIKQRRIADEVDRLAQALMQNPNSIILTNVDAKIEFVNDAFLQSTGFSRDEVIGQNTRILNSGHTPRQTHEELWTSLSEGRVWKGEFHNQRKNGELYDEFAVVAPLRQSDGTITHYVALKEDITEKKRLARELDAYRHGLEDQVQARTAALAAASKFDRCQSQILAIYNQKAPLPDMLSRMLEILDSDLDLAPCLVHLFDPQNGGLTTIWAPHRKATEDQGFRFPGQVMAKLLADMRPLCVDGSSSDNSAILAQAQDLAGDCLAVDIVPAVFQGRMLGVFTLGRAHPSSTFYQAFLSQLADQTAIAIHNHRQFEEMTKLTAMLNERERRIAAQNADLERASRLKSEFLANMSHELRTPLNAIIGFSEVMGDGLVGELNLQQADYVQEIRTAGHYLLSLINDILDLSKIEAGKMTLLLERVDPKALCENAIAMVKERASHLDLRLEIDEPLGHFWADERMLKQILYNLLSNAVKFTLEGTVTVSAKLVDDHPLERVVFAIEDTGIGISLEDQARLFRPFQQVDGSSSRRFEGTGLGLALCRQLAELHGGKIDLESTPEVGTRFEFWLPRRGDPEETSAAQPFAAVPTTGLRSDGLSPLIMLIEDEDPAAELLTLHLKHANCQVVRAASAHEAEAILAVVHPDLIVLDLLLPKPDGWNLLERIKSDPGTSDIPIVVVSIIATENRAEALRLGAAEVLQKPICKADLRPMIDSLHLKKQRG